MMKRKIIMVDFKTVYHYSKDLHVLYVEDNQEVRESTADILREYYTDNKRYYNLVISDDHRAYQQGRLKRCMMQKKAAEIEPATFREMFVTIDRDCERTHFCVFFHSLTVLH